MNPDTGELKRMYSGPDAEKAIQEIERAQKEGFQPVPESHEKAADLKLDGKESAVVSKTSGGKLSTLMAKWRKEKKDKKAVRKARRTNR